jgi:predicted exporter
MTRASRLPVAIWLLGAVLCALVVSRTVLRTDMGAFLPRSASLAQQALTGQATHGAASHVILLAIQGAPPPVLAALSRDVAARLRGDPAFIDVANGDATSFAAVQSFVWANRYLLSGDVTVGRFTKAGLHAMLENDLALLDSDIGGMLQASLPGDPTGEMLTLLAQLGAMQAPATLDGVWTSADGTQALLLVHSAAPGFDIEGQQQALDNIQAAFASSRKAVPGAGTAYLRATGPGVFAVHIQAITKADVSRLSILATAGAVGLLLFAYRSPRVILLGLLPAASGTLAAVAAVSLVFGYVHGVTLGFGVTLIGESLDYAIYLFTQIAPGETANATMARIWPTLRLGAATSVVGFCAMLGSSFVGFAQLGLFSIIGLITAAAVSRFVLPNLVPAGFSAPGSFVLARPLLALIGRRKRLRGLIGLAAFAAGLALLLHRGGLWDHNLANLSPVPAADQALDARLRHALGVPDLRYLAVFEAPSAQAALQGSEALTPALQALAMRRVIGGFDVPSLTLPSEQAQKQRQAALPDDATLRARFAQAGAGLPFRPGIFAPFFAAVAAARAAPALTLADLPPALALRVQSMLVQNGAGWTVLAPLNAVADPAGVAAALAKAPVPGVQLVDLEHESASLLRVFQADACKLAVIGSLAILAVLLAGLRAPLRVAKIAAPLAAAVIVTAALLTCGGAKLSIFMVVGFLLIIAVGSNYCLFFARPAHGQGMAERSVGAIVLANLCTVAAYGLMSFSRIPVLHDIGMTVAIGTFLSLLFGAVLSPPAAS